MNSPLFEEFDYYRRNQAEFGAKYLGKFIVIKDQQVIGCYDEELDAIRTTAGQHQLGTFLVQKCDPDPESCILRFHGRVTV